MLPLVVLKPLYHRKQESIAIHLFQAPELQQAVRTIRGAKWTQTHSCWYLPLTNTHYQQLREGLKDKAVFDTSALKQYLEQRRVLVNANQSTIVTNNQAHALVHHPLCQENLSALQRYVKQLKLKGYSNSTIKTYRNEFVALLRILGKKPVDQMSIEQLQRYVLYCIETEKLQEATIHS